MKEMCKILATALILISGVVLFSFLRYGSVLDGFMGGDGNSVLSAASALLSIWALLTGFSFAVIGAAFHLSKLPARWKLDLFRSHVLIKLIPFILVTLISGSIPFIAIFNIDTSVNVKESSVTAWLLLGFVLQILLIFSAIKASTLTFRELTLLSALKSTLKKIDSRKLLKLKKIHEDTFQNDHSERRWNRLHPMSELGGSLLEESPKEHELLVTVLNSLFRKHDPQILDQGVKQIANWLKDKPIKELDGYFQHRVIPSCFHMLRTEQTPSTPLAFKTRLYFFAILINEIQKNGASLTAANAANPIWNLIDEYAYSVDMSFALEHARMALDELIHTHNKSHTTYSILLRNLNKAIPRLLTERNKRALDWIEEIVRWHQYHIQYRVLKKWPERKDALSEFVELIKWVYEIIDNDYKGEPAVILNGQDIRYRMLRHLRRVQELFVENVKRESLNLEVREEAADVFSSYDSAIEELLTIRKPEGKEDAYQKLKYKSNPYRETHNVVVTEVG